MGRDEVAAALHPVIGDAPLDAVELLSGGLVNTNLRVRAAGAAWLLRIHATPATAHREAALAEALRPRVPAPEILHVDPAGRWSVRRFVPGAALVTVLGTLADPRHAGWSAGEVLGRIHLHTRARAGFLDDGLQVPAPFPSYAEQWQAWVASLLEGRAGARLGARAMALADALDRHRELLDGAGPPWVLCHADYKPTNLVVDARGAVVAVIDWEFAHVGAAGFDLGQLLRWADRYPPAFTEGVAAGYRMHHPLDPDWRRRVLFLDVVNLLVFLDREGDDVVRERDVQERLARTVSLLDGDPVDG